jgi:phytanoyl-CoA hydroxylase
MLRRLKAVYSLYNLFQRKKLHHNVMLYKKLGLNKQYFSPVSSRDFRKADASKLQSIAYPLQPRQTSIFLAADADTQASISAFDQKGFSILKNFLSNAEVDRINQDIDQLLQTGKIHFKNGNKLMFVIQQSEVLKKTGKNEALLELLSSMVNGEVQLFQSINFLSGSEQHTHSDSIHMTTFPLGGLLGVWIALEDIELDNGPLHYYPGSHKLPYYLNSDYDNEGSYFLLGDKDYTEYEKMLEQKISEHGIEKQVFTARKGDLLIWHANLLHGGEPHTNKQKTRKSVVFHYYKTDCICYHEITQRPALMETY